MLAKTYLLCQWATNANVRLTPSGLDITAPSTAANITVTWTNPSTVGTTNEIWRSTDGTTFNLFQTVAGNITQITDSTGLGAGNFFYYKVRSCTNGTCTAFSEIISAVTTYVSANVASISFPTLVRAFGLPTSFMATGLALLSSVSLPKLKRVDGNLDISNNPNLTSLDLSSLQIVTGGALFLGSDKLTGAISFPKLVSTASDLQLQGNSLITSISLPLFQTCGGIFAVSSNTSLISLSCPVLATVTGELQCFGCTVITSFSFPQLNSIGGNCTFNGCTLLNSISFPNVLFQNGATITFNADALAAASVNQVLARGVASGVNTCDFELGAGTNAAPTGQGVADKATLIGQGNTVNTN